MANLLSVCELAWSQLFPNPRTGAKIDKEEFVATGKTELAYQLWLKSKEEKRENGYFEVPSYLLSETEKEVSNNEIDISDLGILRSLENDLWLHSVGGVSCSCKYVRTTVAMYKTLCDDDSLGDDVKLYYVVGKKIKFPKGTHADKLPIIYANNGEKIDENTIIIDDALAGIIRRALLDIYREKGESDETNNVNPNN